MGEPIATVGDLAGMCGRISGAWQKQPLIWGFSDTIAVPVSDLNLGAGDKSLPTPPVIEGEVHVISVISFRVDSGSCTGAQVTMSIKGIGLAIQTQTPPATGIWYLQLGEFILGKDDFLNLAMIGLTAGDDAYLRYAGYRMDIDL